MVITFIVKLNLRSLIGFDTREPYRLNCHHTKTRHADGWSLCEFLKDEGARGSMKSLKGLENGILGKVCPRAFLRKKGAFGNVTSLRARLSSSFLACRLHNLGNFSQEGELIAATSQGCLSE